MRSIDDLAENDNSPELSATGFADEPPVLDHDGWLPEPELSPADEEEMYQDWLQRQAAVLSIIPPSERMAS